MALKRDDKKKRALKKTSRLAVFGDLKTDTKRTIGAVIAFTLGIILFLAGFQKAGQAGSDLYSMFSYLLGLGYFLLPLLAFFVALSLGTEEEGEHHGHRILGSALFFISGLTLLDLIYRGEGGVIGGTIAQNLRNLFDVGGSFVLTIALFVISLLILFEFSFGFSKIFKAIGMACLILIKKIWSSLPFGKKTDATPVSKEIEDIANEAIAQLPQTPLPAAEETVEEPSHVEDESEEDDITPSPTAPKEGISTGAPLFPFTHEEFTPPPLSLLEVDRGKPGVGDIKANANIIKRTLQNFGIAVEMDEISIGPAVTRYAIKPAEGVRLQKIVALQQNLELALAAHPIRIEAPIPGKSLVGIEVPNSTKSIVGLGSLLGSDEYTQSEKPLLVALGRGITGKSFFANIAKMPHALIAGATGSGKSVMIHTIITSLLFRNSPENLRFIMIDPKRVELTLYNKIPHLLNPVITDAKKAILALKWAAKEMDRRYNILEAEGVRDIDSYHKNVLQPELSKMKRKGEATEGTKMPEMMPYICIFIDELADIMQAFPRELEAAIVRLAQMSRAVGIHLILSTQRPSVNVITGLIKANVPSRIALQVASQIDSRTIIDMSGAEKLLGAGDLLYLSADMAQPQRMQSPYITENEVKKVVNYLIKAGEHLPPSEINLGQNGEASGGGLFAGALEDVSEDVDDDLYEEARELVIKAGRASTSYLQRRLRVGYARAARLMDILEEKNVIGPGDGAKPREVLIKHEGMGAATDVEEDIA